MDRHATGMQTGKHCSGLFHTKGQGGEQASLSCPGCWRRAVWLEAVGLEARPACTGAPGEGASSSSTPDGSRRDQRECHWPTDSIGCSFLSTQYSSSSCLLASLTCVQIGYLWDMVGPVVGLGMAVLDHG